MNKKIIDLDKISHNGTFFVEADTHVKAFCSKPIQITVILLKNSFLELILREVVIESKNNLFSIDIILKEENAYAVVRGGFVLMPNVDLNINILQKHESKNSKSDVLIKTCLLKKSKMCFKGKVFAKELAESIQYNKNLLLDDDIQVIVEPSLEIFSENSLCKHGSATSILDEQQLFYLRSRGLSLAQSKKILISGFFEDIEGFSELIDKIF